MSLDELEALADELMEAPVEDLHGHAAVQTGQLMGLAAEALPRLIACVRAADAMRKAGATGNMQAIAYDTARRALGE